MTHYPALYVGYGVAVLCMLLAMRKVPRFTTAPTGGNEFARPWLEFSLSVGAGVLVVLIGQLYQRGVRLPTTGAGGPLLEVINQTVIFLPLPLLLWWRRQSLRTAWIHPSMFFGQIAVGSVIAGLALTAYSLVRAHHPGLMVMVTDIYHPANIGYAAQVFWEDFAIAVVMVRLTACLGRPIVSALLVAALFVVGHIPPMLTSGVPLGDFSGLVLDFLLGVVLISVLQRSRNMIWFWCLHFAMDMTQFHGTMTAPG